MATIASIRNTLVTTCSDVVVRREQCKDFAILACVIAVEVSNGATPIRVSA
jgi:hypothetical protein